MFSSDQEKQLHYVHDSRVFLKFSVYRFFSHNITCIESLAYKQDFIKALYKNCIDPFGFNWVLEGEGKANLTQALTFFPQRLSLSYHLLIPPLGTQHAKEGSVSFLLPSFGGRGERKYEKERKGRKKHYY